MRVLILANIDMGLYKFRRELLEELVKENEVYFCHVAVGAHLCGTVTIGNATWIGAGATVSNNVNICGECTIGAGAVVVKDITEPGTYIGVPARI